MAILSFELDPSFILLAPLLVAAVDNFNSPNELEFVQWVLSVWSQFVLRMKSTLLTNPPPKSHIFLVLAWHCTMPILSFKLDHFATLNTPFLIRTFFACEGFVRMARNSLFSSLFSSISVLYTIDET
jgi:hypothetical protein